MQIPYRRKAGARSSIRMERQRVRERERVKRMMMTRTMMNDDWLSLRWKSKNQN